MQFKLDPCSSTSSNFLVEVVHNVFNGFYIEMKHYFSQDLLHMCAGGGVAGGSRSRIEEDEEESQSE